MLAPDVCLWYAPKPIPGKGGNPNFPHIQSNMRIIPRHAAKHRKNSHTAEKRKMRNVRTVSARKEKNRESGRAALSGMALGDVEFRGPNEHQPRHARAHVDFN